MNPSNHNQPNFPGLSSHHQPGEGRGTAREIFRAIHKPSEPRPTPPTTTAPAPSYSVRFYKNPFQGGAEPSLEWTGKSWEFVRRFALGNVHPDGWLIVDEATGEQMALEEIGTAFRGVELER